MSVSPLAALDALVERVKKAQQIYAKFDQTTVDKIFRAAAFAAADARIPLAVMAHDETGMGVIEDKVVKKPLCLRVHLQSLQRRENLRRRRSR